MQTRPFSRLFIEHLCYSASTTQPSEGPHTPSTPFNQAHQLEEYFEVLALDAQMETEEPKRLRFVDHRNLPAATPRPNANPA